MTAQIPDKLIHRGELLDVADTLLWPVLRRWPKRKRPCGDFYSTSCWRGYIATWEIVGKRLFLVDLEFLMKSSDQDEDFVMDWRSVGLKRVFPKSDGPIFAQWVTDFVRCSEGELLRYVHHGFGSEYERDRFFQIDEGIVREELLRLNPPPPVLYSIGEDGTRTCVSDWREGEVIEDPCAGDPVPTQKRVWGAGG
ncbi:hypothetical protein [Prosthecomicrobium hirschii]|uniref:hypothetical protein n=1 Tax=Prosthecodimorpha hirschii TaxID=665126 RepID=UPI00128FB634|nr:hypothetical protein [Prosthecomicrobium hirschii]